MEAEQGALYVSRRHLPKTFRHIYPDRSPRPRQPRPVQAMPAPRVHRRQQGYAQPHREGRPRRLPGHLPSAGQSPGTLPSGTAQHTSRPSTARPYRQARLAAARAAVSSSRVAAFWGATVRVFAGCPESHWLAFSAAHRRRPGADLPPSAGVRATHRGQNPGVAGGLDGRWRSTLEGQRGVTSREFAMTKVLSRAHAVRPPSGRLGQAMCQLVDG
jgi:hypothetical protein